MQLKTILNRMIAPLGYNTVKLLLTLGGKRGAYAQDGLVSVHNHDFMRDPKFETAYARGVQAAAGDDYQWHWRVHVGLWAAAHAIRVPGDFVECGVNRGCLASAIMKYLDWNSRERTFYLLDTFQGLDERYVSAMEKKRGTLALNAERLKGGEYVAGVESVRQNFSDWRNVQIVVGAIPETLEQVPSRSIAYLHLDMNCAPPEIAAANHFWDRLSPGAVLLLDDYAYLGYEPQKTAMDEFARARGVQILSLPTGQGLLIKPIGANSVMKTEQ